MLLDTRVLSDMSAHTGASIAVDLVTFFIEESHSLIETLIRSAGALDYEAARRTAHSIKSSSGQFGALALQELAQNMEEAAAQAPDRLPLLTRELRQTSAATFEALELWLKEAPRA